MASPGPELGPKRIKLSSTKYLGRAVEEGDLELVKKLLAEGHLPHANDAHGMTPVHKAAKKGSLEMLKLLMDRDPSNHKFLSNLSTWVQMTPLMSALDQRHKVSPDIVKYLLECGADVNMNSLHGDSALHLACESAGNLPILELLINHGANVNVKEAVNDQTPLHKAVHYAMDPDMIGYLIDNGADVLQVDSNDNTPLVFACVQGETKAIYHILRKCPQAVNPPGFSPLKGAIAARNLEVVDILLAAGATVTRGTLKRGCTTGDLNVFKRLLAAADVEELATMRLAEIFLHIQPNKHFLLEFMKFNFSSHNREIKTLTWVTKSYITLTTLQNLFYTCFHIQPLEAFLQITAEGMSLSPLTESSALKYLLKFGVKKNFVLKLTTLSAIAARCAIYNWYQCDNGMAHTAVTTAVLPKVIKKQLFLEN